MRYLKKNKQSSKIEFNFKLHVSQKKIIIIKQIFFIMHTQHETKLGHQKREYIDIDMIDIIDMKLNSV